MSVRFGIMQQSVTVRLDIEGVSDWCDFVNLYYIYNYLEKLPGH
jgi:hypothetical protein